MGTQACVQHIPLAATSLGEPDAALARAVERACCDLNKRFPGAGLKRLSLVRGESFDGLADPTGQTRVWLASECEQVTGSFKVRGALCALAAAQSQGHRSVVAASAGNHAAGVAHAAAVLKMTATVVVPASAAQTKCDRIRAAGAHLVQVPGSYDEAELHARWMAETGGSPFVSPYDDDHVLAGNGASLAYELVQALGRVPEHVVAPIGGGGLATGLSWGLAQCANADRRRRVWTAQSQACAAFAQSVRVGRAVETCTSTGPTLAEGLEGGISARAFARASAAVLGVTVVPEACIAAAMRAACAATGLRLEGSAAVGVAMVLQPLPQVMRGGDLVVVLTGRNVDEDVFAQVVKGPFRW